MKSIAGLRCISMRRFCRRIPPPQPPPPSTTASSGVSPLLFKLLREPDDKIKLALDSDAASTTHHDAAFWDPLLAALASSSPTKPHLVMEWRLNNLLNAGVRERDRYIQLLSSCASIRNPSLAMKIFASMETRRIQPTTDVFNALLSTFLSVGDVVTGLSLFEIMDRSEDCKPDLATYRAFLVASSRDSRGTMEWYSAMKKAGFTANVQIYEVLLTVLVKSEKFEDADRVYEEVVSSGVLPSVAILESVLEGLCKRSNVSKVRELVDGGWELNEAMVEKLLNLYLELGLVEEMEMLLGHLNPSFDPSVFSRVHCGIIRFYASLDRLDDMEFSVRRMLKGGVTFTRPQDVEAIVCAYFRRKAFERLDLFLNQVRGSYKLGRSTYDVLVAGYRRFELNERLNLVVDDMKRDGFAL